MLTSSLGVVLCRVGAVLLFVECAKSFQYVLPALMNYGRLDLPVILIVFSTVIPAVAGIGLWVFAERICRVNLESADIEIRSSLEALDLVSIGTLLIGMYAVFYGIVGALTSESMIWTQAAQARSMPDGFNQAANSFLPTRVSNVSQILLGLALILGRQSIARLLMTARHAGTGGGK